MRVLPNKATVTAKELDFIEKQILDGNSNSGISREFEIQFERRISSITIKKIILENLPFHWDSDNRKWITESVSKTSKKISQNKSNKTSKNNHSNNKTKKISSNKAVKKSKVKNVKTCKETSTENRSNVHNAVLEKSNNTNPQNMDEVSNTKSVTNEKLEYLQLSKLNKIDKSLSNLHAKFTKNNPYETHEKAIDEILGFLAEDKKSVSVNLSKGLVDKYKVCYEKEHGNCQNLSTAISIALYTMIYKNWR